MQNHFKQCPNGHYYLENLSSCPYCKSNSGSNPGSRIYFNQTLIQCPKCGQFSPGPDKCIYCGANLHVSIQLLAETSSNLKENKLNPKLCCYSWYRLIHRKKLDALRKQAEQEYWNATIGGNPIERSEWYQVMRTYIDKKVDKIISYEQCYKYGLPDLDNEVKAGFYKKGKMGYCHAFWVVKKALIKQDYGLIWYTPQEMEPDTQFD